MEVRGGGQSPGGAKPSGSGSGRVPENGNGANPKAFIANTGVAVAGLATVALLAMGSGVVLLRRRSSHRENR